jgi:hypothetical protein
MKLMIERAKQFLSNRVLGNRETLTASVAVFGQQERERALKQVGELLREHEQDSCAPMLWKELNESFQKLFLPEPFWCEHIRWDKIFHWQLDDGGRKVTLDANWKLCPLCGLPKPEENPDR